MNDLKAVNVAAGWMILFGIAICLACHAWLGAAAFVALTVLWWHTN